MAPRTAALLLGVLAVGATGCYSPNIAPGTVHCAALPAKQCPDGFVCSGTFCVKPGTVATGSGGATGGGTGSGGATGSGGVVGTGGMVGTGGSGAIMNEYESCNIMNAGPTQTDNCAPGLKCVDDCGTTPHCYRMCTADAECPQSACTRMFSSATGKFCEQPFVTCDLQAPSGATNGCTASRTCHLISPASSPMGGDRSTCECQTGSQSNNMSCRDTRDCFGGLVCAPMGMPGGENCHFLCDPMKGAAACTSGTCRLLATGSRWGYCF